MLDSLFSSDVSWLSSVAQALPQTSPEAYIDALPDEFYEAYKAIPPPFDGAVGEVVYLRTYSRIREDLGGRRERWWETCKRCMESIIKMGCRFTEQEAKELFDAFFNLEVSFSGRALWQLGTQTVARLGGASLNNCWGVVVDKISAFTFAFDNLMLGGGVGFNIQREYVAQLPKVHPGVHVSCLNTADADFIVPDSREGWVRLLHEVLQAFFVTGKSFTYSTILVRKKGEKIKGFGGFASGPGDLIAGIQDICSVLKECPNGVVRPIDALDIMCFIGRTVVAGNVRRSALLSIGDVDDIEYLKAKRFDGAGCPDHRRYVNTSVNSDCFHGLPGVFWEPYEKECGEPYGMVNLDLARRMGRAGDWDRIDPYVRVFNPCGEVNVEDHEACNLFTLFWNRIKSLPRFLWLCRMGTRITKTVGLLSYHDPATAAVVQRNMRLGVSVTGVYQKLLQIGLDGLRDWLDAGYRAVDEEDRRYSSLLGVKRSIKLTVVQPSGTLSKLAGSTPGAHPAYAEYVFNRIRFASDDPLVPVLRERGYHCEFERDFATKKDKVNTTVVTFPVHFKDAITADQVSVIDHLEMLKLLNTHWSDNSTSITAYYRPQELPAIRAWLAENGESVKSVSFLRHVGHGFDQAPLEPVTKERYEAYCASLTPWSEIEVDYGTGDLEGGAEGCQGASCPAR